MRKLKKHHLKKMAKKDKTEFIIFLILVSVLVITLLIYSSSKNKQNLSANNFSSVESGKRPDIPTPTRTPRKIPHGKMEFSVGQSDKTVPQLSKGSIDPYDPENGTTQTMTIAVKHSQPVDKVTATLKTDNATSQPYFFRLVKGTNTDGEWQGSWKVTDTYLYTYVLTLNAVSSDSLGMASIALR